MAGPYRSTSSSSRPSADTAAAQAVLEGAGGQVVDPRGRPFRYNQRDTILNGDFIALGDPALPWRDWLGG